jgi:hypothetical protein
VATIRHRELIRSHPAIAGEWSSVAVEPSVPVVTVGNRGGIAPRSDANRAEHGDVSKVCEIAYSVR